MVTGISKQIPRCHSEECKNLIWIYEVVERKGDGVKKCTRECTEQGMEVR